MQQFDKHGAVRLRFAACLCWIALVASTSAQTALQRRAPVQTEYSLGAGDQIRISVADVDDIPDRPIRIDPSGEVDLPLIGTVQAAGLTPEQLRFVLQTRFEKYVRSPRVTVNVTEYESRPVSLLGAVAHPGVYQMNSPKHLVDVLSLAGGASPDAGSTVIVTRQNAKGELAVSNLKTETSGEVSTVTIPLDDITSGRSPEDNILVLPGDAITLPKAEVIYVLGNVKRAGGFSLATHPSLTVIQAVTLAEGFSSNASAGHARILRRVEANAPPKEIRIDANRILNGKDPDQILLANDILYIPNSALKASSKRALEAAIGVTTAAVIYR